MDLKNLRGFHLVSQHRTLRKAANYLNLTPAAVSIQLKKLEGELQVKLFDRHPNKLVLTDHGRILAKELQNLFQYLSKLEETVRQQTNRYSEKLTIALGRDLPTVFAPRIAAFTQMHPNLRLTMLCRSSEDTISLLLDGDVDIGIGWFPKLPKGFHRRQLLDRKIHIIFLRTHELSGKKRISLPDIGRFPLILHSGGGTRHLIESGFSSNGIELENVLEVGNCGSVIDFVRLGLGLGFVHDICLPSKRDDRIRSLDVTGEFGSIQLSVIHKRSTAFKPWYQALIQGLSRAY